MPEFPLDPNHWIFKIQFTSYSRHGALALTQQRIAREILIQRYQKNRAFQAWMDAVYSLLGDVNKMHLEGDLNAYHDHFGGEYGDEAGTPVAMAHCLEVLHSEADYEPLFGLTDLIFDDPELF